LKNEASGIFAWLVRGCLEYQRLGGLCPPKIVKYATAEYRNEEDELRQFMNNNIVRSLGEKDIRTSELYELYKEWYHEACLSGQVISMKRFVQRLVAMGYTRDDSGRYPVFKLKGTL
jgi:putative DNA primase/helicase